MEELSGTMQPIAIVYDEAIISFAKSFEPVSFPNDADEIFTFGRLREYMNAFPAYNMPDPMPEIVDRLKEYGFMMSNELGELALYVKRKSDVIYESKELQLRLEEEESPLLYI